MKCAVITGASSGLGAEFARQTAKGGRYERIILIARRAERLEKLAKEISAPGITVCVLPLDLVSPDAAETVEKSIGADELCLLVNCAGFGKMGEVVSLGKVQRDMTELNCIALTSLCAMAAGKMHEGGRIINIASIAAFVPTPNLAVYGAGKAYVLSFSKALSREVRNKGITVTAVCPGPADTEFFAVAGIEHSKLFDSLVHLSPEYVVRAALKASEKKKWVCTPHPLYKLYRVLSKLLPDRFFIRFTRA